jgi:hypothetical protein
LIVHYIINVGGRSLNPDQTTYPSLMVEFQATRLLDIKKTIFLRKFKLFYLKCLVRIINVESFQNENNLWSIFSKLNLRNFKWHLKIGIWNSLFLNFQINTYEFFIIANSSLFFSKITYWPLNFLKITNRFFL